jgi:signal transduction histidine kinase
MDTQLSRTVEALASCTDRCARLRASLQRLIADHDAVTERIERDLHDGLQQRLTTMGMELQLLESARPAGDQDAQALAVVGEELAALAAEARRLSRRIFPAILTEGGIAAALRSYARQAPLPVELDLSGLRRYPNLIEMTAYRLVVDVAERASGSYVSVRAGEESDHLRLAITADGDGGILISVPIRDRLDALEATLRLEATGDAAVAVVEFPAALAGTR